VILSKIVKDRPATCQKISGEEILVPEEWQSQRKNAFYAI
jgi:hypothetical protein